MKFDQSDAIVMPSSDPAYNVQPDESTDDPGVAGGVAQTHDTSPSSDATFGAEGVEVNDEAKLPAEESSPHEGAQQDEPVQDATEDDNEQFAQPQARVGDEDEVENDVQDSDTEEPSQPEVAAKSSDFEEKDHPPTTSTMSKVLLAAGPLFLLGSLVISLIMLSGGGQELQQFPTGTGVSISNKQEYAHYAPTNPKSVSAWDSSAKNQLLTPGNPYSFANPYFEWSGMETNEPEVTITGYFVYFVDTTQRRDSEVGFTPILVDTPSFSPQDHGITLQPGKKYSLLIQTITDGGAPFGFDRASRLFSKSYFVYHYE